MMCMGGYKDLDIITFPIIILFLIVFPVVLFLWALFTMANTIRIDEKGVARYRFGKKIKEFSWSEIKNIDCTSENLFTGWCYISNENKKYDYSSVTKMRLDKTVIYFHLSNKAINALKTYHKSALMIEKLEKKI